MKLKAFVFADKKNPIARLVFSEPFGGNDLALSLAKHAQGFLGEGVSFQWSKDWTGVLIVPADPAASEDQLKKCVKHIASVLGIDRSQITFCSNYACK